jgi:dTMP kinase
MNQPRGETSFPERLSQTLLAAILSHLESGAGMTERTDRLQGRFIVLDGPDGGGKSTHVRMLSEAMEARGVSVVTARDPGGTPIGDKIREILLDRAHTEMAIGCETLLYMASRAQLMSEVIRPALEAGSCVICDRWVSATIAYQVAGGTQRENVLMAYRSALDGLWPDLTILLDLPVEAGLARLGKADDLDRMEVKDLEFHRRVRELFLEQASAEPGRFAVVDASTTIDDVHRRLLGTLDAREWC